MMAALQARFDHPADDEKIPTTANFGVEPKARAYCRTYRKLQLQTP